MSREQRSLEASNTCRIERLAALRGPASLAWLWLDVPSDLLDSDATVIKLEARVARLICIPAPEVRSR